MKTPRDYAALHGPMSVLVGSREDRMVAAADLLWNALGAPAEGSVSWIGFYLKVPARDEMVLGPARDKPACSPIGLHGACGRAWLKRTSLVVPDVEALGEGYIACDPKDRSEVVVPLFDGDGCWGVLDADSYDIEAFTDADAAGLARLMNLAGLTTDKAPPVTTFS